MLSRVPNSGECRLPLSRTRPTLLRINVYTNSPTIGSCRSRARVGLANHRPPTWSLRLLPRPRQSLHAASASEAESSVDEDREKKLFEKMSKSQLEDLYTRLCENDVEYNDMKHVCKDNRLGGRDMKHNLRAKLIRRLRELLGMELPDPLSHGHKVKRPSAMSDKELTNFYKQRGIVKPEDRDELVNFAIALLVADKILPASEMPSGSSYDRWNVNKLQEECRSRKLSHNGNKADLIGRLTEYDEKMEIIERRYRASIAAKREKEEASIDKPPLPPSLSMAQDLREAKIMMMHIKNMGLPELRTALFKRRLPVYGTLEVLVERLTNVIRSDVVAAHAGFRRMVKYAEAAVAKLTEDEVYAALATRGLVSHSASEGSTARLANSLVEEWIEAAMKPLDSEEEEEEGEEDDDDGRTSGSTFSDEDRQEDLGNGRGPVIDVVLVCGGDTVGQRESALAAARAALPGLQSDPIWGTLRTDRIAGPLDGSVEADPATIAIAAAASQVPPTDSVHISSIDSVANGVVVTLSLPLPPVGCRVVVTATPADENPTTDNNDNTKVVPVSVECRTQDVLVTGLAPRTEYNFTAKLRNAMSVDGPESEPVYFATFDRSGVAAHVVYAVKCPNPHRPTQFPGHGESWAYVRLDWEDLMGSSASELDARFGSKLLENVSSTEEVGAGLAGVTSLDDVIAGAHVVLPLGLPSGEASLTVSHSPHVACTTSWGSEQRKGRIATTRPAFCQTARALGYPAKDLLELTMPPGWLDGDAEEGGGSPNEVVAAAAGRISEWLSAQGEDPMVARVAVRVESPGSDGAWVLGAGIGRGAEQLAAGAASLCEMHGVNRVVLERVHPAAVHFNVTVLQGEKSGAAVALVPTEISYDDLEEHIQRSELQISRFRAVQEGHDPEKIDALFALYTEETRMDPSALGTTLTAKQRVMHSTPPASLPAGITQRIRVAAAKLFTDMGLKDFAQFSGWVVPDDPVSAAGLGMAMDLYKAATVNDALDNASKTVDGEANGNDNDPEDRQRPKIGKSFAELAEIDAAERAELAAAHAVTVAANNSVGAEDAEGAVDVEVYTYAADEEEPEAALANGPVLREVGEGVQSEAVRYGVFKGIELDGRTREDIKSERRQRRAPGRPIPEAAPEVVAPTALTDLGALDAASICHVDDRVIAFNGLTLSPQLGEGLGPLAQQTASAGLPLRGLARRLVSSAAQRAGYPPLPAIPEFLEDPGIDDEWPPRPAHNVELVSAGLLTSDAPMLVHSLQSEGFTNDIDGLGNGRVVSLEEIGAALEAWDAPEPLPMPESYDDIRAEAEADSASGFTSDEEAEAAATAAGLDAVLPDASSAAMEINFPNLNGDDEEEEEVDDEEWSAESDAALLAREFPGLHPNKQRVWVLCGGEGPQRDESLRAAVHAMECLQGAPDLLIETFFMDPPDAGSADTERRQKLLQRRADLIKLGATDDELLEDFPEFHPNTIRYPAAAPPQDLVRRGVWRLAGSHVVRANVGDMKDGCEAALSAATTAEVNRREGDKTHGIEQLLATTRGELELAGISIGGPAPWGGLLSSPRSPHFCFMADWVAAAAQQCVVVLLALPGHPSAQGPLQELLEERKVPFTGPSSIAAKMCSNRKEMMEVLHKYLHYDGSMIDAREVHNISGPELSGFVGSTPKCDEEFSKLFGNYPGKMLVIKPKNDAGGLGVARLGCGEDLQTYAAAVGAWSETIPCELLSVETEDVNMVLPPPTQFVIENYIPAPTLQLRRTWTNGETDATTAVASPSTETNPLHRRIHLPSTDPWLEVRACMLGDAGAMRCLELTTTVAEIEGGSNDTYSPMGISYDKREDVVTGTFDLTPPPPQVLHPAMAADVRARMQLIADRLGLSGAAQISALISTVNGKIVVLDVDPHPDLRPDGLLMRQAAATPELSRALSPAEVLRELLKLGMSRGEELGLGLGVGMGMGMGSAVVPYGDSVAEGTAQRSSSSAGNGVGQAYGMVPGSEVAREGKDPPSPAQEYYGEAYLKLDIENEEYED